MTALVTGPSFAYDPVTLARERRPRMLVALLVSSALVPLAFLAAASLARWVSREPTRVVLVSPSTVDLVPRVPALPSGALAPPPHVPIQSRSPIGIPVPRPEASWEGDLLRPADGEPDLPGSKDGGIVLGQRAGEADRPINLPGEPLLVDRLPNPVHTVKPGYPELARDARLEGLVVVFVLVGRDGRVLDLRLDPARHAPLLDAAALAAAGAWRFEPAMTGGHAVAAWVSVPFRFVLQGGD